MDRFVVSTHGWLLTGYGQEGDNNHFHGETIFNDALASWCWWNYYGPNLLWRVALGFSLCRNQAHSQWQWCFCCWYFVLRNINLRDFQELVLIVKMPMLSVPLNQLHTWHESPCYMFNNCKDPFAPYQCNLQCQHPKWQWSWHDDDWLCCHSDFSSCTMII